MYQNADSPFYSLDMEVLCSLSRWPAITRLSDLASDLGFKTQRGLREHLDRLKKEWGLYYAMDDGHRGVCVERNCWYEVWKDASEYWSRVYKASGA